MAKVLRPRVALLFAGGTTIAERGRTGTTVTKPQDISAWIRQMAETEILADSEGFFISSGLQILGIPDWQKISRVIADQYADFDGFVVIHQAETLSLAATALSCILGQLGKPVVLVGSSLLSTAERAAGRQGLVKNPPSEFGVKASFINAVQVAVSDVGEVVVVHGSHVYRGDTVTSTVMDGQRQTKGEVLGKIDFGLRLSGQQQRRRTGALRLRLTFDTSVTVVEYVPGIDPQQIAAMARESHGLFVSSAEGLALLQSLLSPLNAAVGRSLPIVLYSLHQGAVLKTPANMVISPPQSRSAAVLRLMWALGQPGKGSSWKSWFLAAPKSDRS